jgi:signal transduction histidine kinase/ligand-binding sensor domain-containing protein
MALLLMLLILASGARTFCQYNFSSWTTDDGLPQNSVYAILQTRDGYLWFTTLDGLVRFDGVSFTNFSKSNTKGLKSNRFNCLLEDDRGDLWIGTADGGITRYHAGEFTTYATADGLPDDTVSGLIKDKNGFPLVLTTRGVVRWQGNGFESYPLPATVAYNPSNPALASRDGAVFWYANQGVLTQFGEGRTANVYKYEPVSVYLVYEDSQKNVWLGSVKDGVIRFSDGVFTSLGVRDGLPSAAVTAIFEDRDHNVWIGTRAGLCVFKDGRFTTYTRSGGKSGDYIRSAYQDREGNIWAGTDNQGINRLTRQAVTFYTAKDGLATDNVYPIFQDHLSAIWIGGRDGTLTRYKDGIFSTVIKSSGGPFDSTTALGEDRTGRLWIGRISSIEFLKDGKRNPFNPGMPFGSVIVRAIHEDRTGVIWFATSAGLLKYQNDSVTLLTNKDGLAGDDVVALLEDSRGQLWAGTYGGLSVYESGAFKSFTEKDGLPSDHIRALYEDADGVLWIGTYDGGLGRFKDGRFTRYTVNEGLYNNGVFAILDDGRGYLWMSCNRGIYRVSRQQLSDFAAGKTSQISSIAYGKQDGMLNIECNGARQPAGYRMSDGKLWFPTQGGVAVIDPAAVSDNPLPPPVAIENCLLQRNNVDCQRTIDIRPGQENLEVHYTGLSLIKSDQVRFKYRLEGADSDWVEAGTRRVAYFSYLPPGSYTFKVIAANSDGVWNTDGATLHIMVHPPFWRTWWFVSMIALAVAALMFTGYTYRVKRLRKAHAVQEAFSRQLIQSQEHERKRIAGELHDSLGQNLLIIKNRALLGSAKSDEPEAAKQQFDTISSSASQAIDEVREIAYNLRPYHLDRLGLRSTIEAMLEKIAASSDIRFTVEVAPIDELFSKEDEINIYRIVQECVNNVLRHSQATEARVVVNRTDDVMQITVSDNGQGFSAAERAQGHRGLGLTGIAERTKMLGGTYRITSAPGQGTTVNVSISTDSRRGESRGDGNHLDHRG